MEKPKERKKNIKKTYKTAQDFIADRKFLVWYVRDPKALAILTVTRRKLNANLFREQLAFFDGVNYSEQVVFKEGFAVPDEEIKAALVEWSLAR